MRALKDITLGQYYSGDSVIHRLDPRTKLALCMLIMISLFARNDWRTIAIWGAIFILVLYRSGIPKSVVFKNLRAFRWLFSIIIILNLFYVPATEKPLLIIWGFAIDSTKLNFAFINGLRLVLLIVFSSLLTLTTSPLEITDALDRVLKPLRRFRFPVREFTLMISIAMRFIPTILLEAERIRKAQISRGADFSGSLVKRIRALIPLTLPLFLSTFQRAEELATAMEARCFDASAPRTQFSELAWTRLDTSLIFLGFLTGAILISL
jgi:energy-coupling factor transport system permease protein